MRPWQMATLTATAVLIALLPAVGGCAGCGDSRSAMSDSADAARAVDGAAPASGTADAEAGWGFVDAAEPVDTGAMQALDAGEIRRDANTMQDSSLGMDASVDAGPRIIPELCDGSDTVRLRYGIFDSPSRLPPGEAVMVQNGSGYWIVTGHCDYYVMRDSWRETRTGRLSHQRAQEIAAAVYYDRLDEYAGNYRFDGFLADGSVVRLGNATDVINCYGRCDTGPPEAQDAMDYAYSLLWEELYDEGNAVDGPIRISLFKNEAPPAPDNAPAGVVIDWPLSVAPEPFSATLDELDSYLGHVITADEDVQKLRYIRERVWAGDYGRDWRPANASALWIWGEDMLASYDLRFRDVIPIEDADGNILMDFSSLVNDDADAGL